MTPTDLLSSAPSFTGGSGGDALGGTARQDVYWSSPFYFSSIGGGGSLNTALVVGALVAVAWLIYKK